MDTFINFHRSHMIFRTRREGSYGRFEVESVGAWVDAASGRRERYCLGSAVMAGNVYAETGLPKEPAYRYQLVASRAHHRILRDFGPAQPPQDTAAPNETLFSSLEISLVERSARELTNTAEVIAAVLGHEPLNVRLELSDDATMPSSQQFPVRHINADPHRGLFQIETGPVALVAARPGSMPLANVELAFVFINRRDQCELLVQRPVSPGALAPRFFHERRACKARVAILAAAVGETTEVTSGW